MDATPTSVEVSTEGRSTEKRGTGPTQESGKPSPSAIQLRVFGKPLCLSSLVSKEKIAVAARLSRNRDVRRRNVCSGNTGVAFSKDIGLRTLTSVTTKGTFQGPSFYIQ